MVYVLALALFVTGFCVGVAVVVAAWEYERANTIAKELKAVTEKEKKKCCGGH